VAVSVAALSSTACYPREAAQQRREAALERDPVPLLYAGPLTVEYGGNLGREIHYSDHGRRRIELIMPTGRGHSIDDLRQRKVFYWTDWEPNEPVKVRPLDAAALAQTRRWHGVTTARRIGPCEFAGEVGSFYRQVLGPGFKGPYLVRYQACITPDGVLLADGSVSGDGQIHSTMQATKVSRGRLPDNVFTPPPRQ